MLIYLLDDSKIDLVKLEHFIEQFATEKGANVDIKPFSSPTDFLRCYEEANEKPDLVFLDIYMEDINGMDIAKKLRELGGNDFRLFFTTSSDEFAMEAFSVYADGYVKKPYRYDDFKRALARLEDSFRNESKVITFHSIRQDVPLHVANILFAETADHKVDIHTEKGVVTASMSMKELEQLICQESGFITCGQSYIINMARIKDVTRDTIIMDDLTSIVIPVRLRKMVLAQIKEYNNKLVVM